MIYSAVVDGMVFGTHAALDMERTEEYQSRKGKRIRPRRFQCLYRNFYLVLKSYYGVLIWPETSVGRVKIMEVREHAEPTGVLT